jgi:DUF971 family protein
MTVRLTAVRAPHGSAWFEADFSDGYQARVPNWVLRGYCPCAACQGHGGEIRFQTEHNSELRDISPIGRYALGLTWGDLHSSGIYSFDYLRKLCELYTEHGEALSQTLPLLPR